MKTLSLKLAACDELVLRIEVDQNGMILSSKLTGLGGPLMLQLLGEWRGKLKGELKKLPLPDGTSGPELMLRELILKARDEWVEPYADEEICHCRSVPTKVVHQAIMCGAHSPEAVSRWTSASTSCGNCRKDVIAMLKAQGLKAG